MISTVDQLENVTFKEDHVTDVTSSMLASQGNGTRVQPIRYSMRYAIPEPVVRPRLYERVMMFPGRKHNKLKFTLPI